MKLISNIPPELDGKEPHETDFHAGSCITTMFVCLLIWAGILLSVKCHSQSITVGTGVVTTGQWVSKITAQQLIAGRWGFGLKGIDQDLSDDKPNQQYTFEMHQWSVSLIYTPVHINDISFYVGGGKGKSYESDRVEAVCYTTAEIGFMYRLIKPRKPTGRFALILDWSIDSYSGVNVLGNIEIKLF